MNAPAAVSIERVAGAILFIRGQRVLLDADIASLYGVETKALNRAVKRNFGRFPDDFMFRLTIEEAEILRCQVGTSSLHGGRRYLPFVFTEQGVAMLSSVLHSDRAILANIAIMRAFVKLRQVLSANDDLARKLAALERRLGAHDSDLRAIYRAIQELAGTGPPRPRRRRIGFEGES